MKDTVFTIIVVALTLFAINLFTSCDIEIINKKDVDSVSLTSNTEKIDIDTASSQYITLTAKAKNKKGDEISASIDWEYDREVFRPIGTPSSTLRLELNTDNLGYTGRDITGRTIVKAKCGEKVGEAIINVTGKLKNLWFQDKDGNRVESIKMNQNSSITFSIGTYPRAAESTTLDLIGKNTSENENIAQIIVNKETLTATIISKQAGKATLTLSLSDGSKSVSINP